MDKMISYLNSIDLDSIDFSSFSFSSILAKLNAIDFHLESFAIASAVILAATLIWGILGRFVFGKRSSANHAVSSAIAILFLYAATIALYCAGADYHFLVAPLPFLTLSGNTAMVFSFGGANYAVICSHLLSMVILAFFVNLLDVWIPKGKSFFGWLFFRCLTVALSLVLHLLITYIFSTYLPEGIVAYAPTVLLWLLLILLAVGAFKLIIGLILASVNPIIGALYTFFFATLVGKQLSKALLSTAILAGIVYALNYFGIMGIVLASAALIAYIPLMIVLIIIWYILSKLL